jgi:hypothetical protein
MSTEQAGVTKPSKVAITKLLAEAEVARRRSLRPWLLAFLLPLLAGAALIAFSSYEVYVRLQLIKSQNEQIKANNATIEEQKKAIAANEEKTQGLTAAINNVTDPTAKQQIINTIASNPTVAATTPRVFIQIHDEEQRKKAADVAQSLKNSGFIVPGIERRPEKVDGNQVKYFRQEDKDAAVKVAAVIAGRGVADAKPVLAGGNAPPGQIEIWFAPATDDGGSPPPTPTPAPSGVFAVIRGDFNTLKEAASFADELRAQNPPYPVEIYRHVDGSRYYVTLGGHLTYAEAKKRTEYANKAGYKGAYPSEHATGDNLYH